MYATLLISALTVLPLVGLPASASAVGVYAPPLQYAQANCSAAAQQVVNQTGGQLLSVSPGPNGSCEVTVLVPGSNNERPRKVTRTVQAQ